MDFRSYGRDWDAADYAFFSFIFLACAFVAWIVVSAEQSTRTQYNEKKAYKAKCIDAGGVPTAPFDYVKGHGEGYLCINPSAIIEVE